MYIQKLVKGISMVWSKEWVTGEKMDKQLFGDVLWIGSLSVALVNIVAAIVKKRGRCKQELRVVAWLYVIMEGYIGTDKE